MVEQNNDTDESEVYEFVTKGLHVTFNGLYYTRSASQTFRSASLGVICYEPLQELTWRRERLPGTERTTTIPTG